MITATMIPYNWEPIDIEDFIDFDPDEPEPHPDAMLQNPVIIYDLMPALHDRLTDGGRNTEVFMDTNTFLCYDRSNLNVRIQPDCYVAIGVDAETIRKRRLYLPWEAGKPPDFALEVASETTARHDITDKMEIYRRIGIPELWQFDPTGGDLYGSPLAGYMLRDGVYVPFEITVEPDGILSGYSPTIGLRLCWRDGRLLFQDPDTGEYLKNSHEAYIDGREARHELESERAAHEATRFELDATRMARERARARIRELEERLRRRGESV